MEKTFGKRLKIVHFFQWWISLGRCGVPAMNVQYGMQSRNNRYPINWNLRSDIFLN